MRALALTTLMILGMLATLWVFRWDARNVAEFLNSPGADETLQAEMEEKMVERYGEEIAGEYAGDAEGYISPSVQNDILFSYVFRPFMLAGLVLTVMIILSWRLYEFMYRPRPSH